MKVPKIILAEADDNYRLMVTFSDGQKREFDCKTIIERNENFHKLSYIWFFKKFQIDTGGHGISWDDYVDISEYEIFSTGKKI